MEKSELYTQWWNKPFTNELKNRRKEVNLQMIAKLEPLSRYIKSPVLDVGCGYNHLMDYFKSKDISYNRLDLCPPNEPNFIKDDIERDDLPINMPRYNTILMLDVLEHLIYFDKALNNCHEMLAEGGALIIHIPHIFSLKNRIKFLFGNGGVFDYEGTLGHVFFPSIKMMKDLLEKHGFRIRKIKGYGKLSAFPSLCGSIMIISEKKMSIEKVINDFEEFMKPKGINNLC